MNVSTTRFKKLGESKIIPFKSRTYTQTPCTFQKVTRKDDDITGIKIS